MSSAIPDQAEAVWREFQTTSISESIENVEARSQTRTKHGISESISSPKSSGNKCKEPKLDDDSDEEDDDSDEEVPAPKKSVAEKRRKMGKKGKKGKRPIKKAELSNKVESESESSDGSGHEYEFVVRPRYIPGVLCSICDGAHYTPCCSIQTVVPPNTHINDGYVRSCRRCGHTVDPNLFCPRCRAKVRALIRRRS